MSIPNDGMPSISVREAAERLAQPDADALLLDVREGYEFAPRRAKGAVNIPMSELQRRADEVPRDREVLVLVPQVRIVLTKWQGEWTASIAL